MIGKRRVAEKYNVPHEVIRDIFDKNWRAACKGLLSNEEYMAMFARALNMKAPLPDVSDFWTDHHVPILQTHALVHELTLSYRVGILTNAEKGAMKHALQKGLLPSVSWASKIDSSEHGTIKPEDRIYEIAEKASGVKPSEIFFVDDVPAHITAAQKRGWHGMVFDTNDVEKSIKKLKEALL